MPALIDAEDYTLAFNLPPYENGSAELKQLQFFIRFASGKARKQVLKVSAVGIDEGLEDGSLDRDLMIGTMATAVKRALDAWRLGWNVRSRQFVEESTEYETSSASTSLVYFTEDEIESLVPVQQLGSTSAAFSITPYSPRNGRFLR